MKRQIVRLSADIQYDIKKQLFLSNHCFSEITVIATEEVSTNAQGKRVTYTFSMAHKAS